MELQPDLCVTAAYGNILPQRFLDIPRFGTLNIHPSLLPRFRGAAPVQRALQVHTNTQDGRQQSKLWFPKGSGFVFEGYAFSFLRWSLKSELKQLHPSFHGGTHNEIELNRGKSAEGCSQTLFHGLMAYNFQITVVIMLENAGRGDRNGCELGVHRESDGCWAHPCSGARGCCTPRAGARAAGGSISPWN